jgi:tRNA 5-methylaminomethyl-2-thiouridine biosynthesis bifunctional protein
MRTALAPARLGWEHDRPRSLAYADVYFSAQDPAGEVQTVFIDANDLPARFRTARRFSIGETGFGTGLNFSLTLDAWRRHAPRGAFLSYLSVEAHPLTPSDLARSLQGLGIPQTDIRRLLEQYPPSVTGLHRLHFPEERVALTLVYGDATPSLAQVRGFVDAWFLDGFAPSRNPEMWNLALFRQLARLSTNGTTFGTFTAAGQVRRDLEEVGFSVKKAPGFGGKRERSLGVFRAGTRPPSIPQTVAIAGAGIAGLTVAAALRDRGVAVTLFDPKGPGGRASGNPAALLTPHLAADDPARNALSLAGIRATQALVHGTGADAVPDLLLARGVEHRGISAHAARRLARLLSLDPRDTGGLFAVLSPRVGRPILFYPDGLGLDLGGFCAHLARDLPQERRSVDRLLVTADGPVCEIAGELRPFDTLIVATGTRLPNGLPGQPQPAVVGGQMTRVSGSLAVSAARALTGQGYCLPERAGQHWLGATYRRDGVHGIRMEDDAENLRHLSWLDQSLRQANTTGAWYGERAVFSDRLPVVGPCVPTADTNGCPARQHGVWLNLGYGSRGLLYAPLLGQWLADHICGLPEPLPAALSALFDPARLIPET